jgi:uncharacterized protein (TIRG00374 family)
MFLPTSVGGDVVKAHEMSKVSKDPVEAYSAVFMERLTGAIAILILALIATTIYIQKLSIDVIVFVYFVFPPIFILMIVLFLKEELVRKFEFIYKTFFWIFRRFSIGRKARKLYDSVNLYLRDKKVVFFALVISLVFQIMAILMNYMLSMAIGMDVPIYYFFIFIPISVIFSFLPISIRGIGVREVIFVYLFTEVGATAAQAVSLGFIGQIYMLIPSLLGSYYFIASGARKRHDKINGS